MSATTNPPSLLSLLAEPPSNSRTRNKCKLARIMAEMSEREQDRMTEVLSDPRWSSAAIATALGRAVGSIDRTAVHVHRKARCCCTERVAYPQIGTRGDGPLC